MPQIVHFDGVCNLCNNAVQFIINRDLQSKFLFCSLQSERSKEELAKFNFSSNLDSLVLQTESAIYVKSDAALKIARELNNGWPIFYYLFFPIPKVIRDFFYGLVAKHRYKIFGKSNECWIPTPELKKRFIT